MKRWKFLLAAILAILATSLRLYGLMNPVADWHSWRQSDTAAVARNFAKFGFDPLRPRFDDLSNIPSGKDNPMGWRMAEFPLYQIIAYGLFRVVPVPIETALRIVTIAASAGTLVLLYVLLLSTGESLTAIIASLAYATLPFSVYFGRVILPDPSAVFLSVFSLYLLQKHRLVSAAIAAGAAILVKPFAVFLLFPAPYLLWRQTGFSFAFVLRAFVYALMSVLPVWLWRNWMLQYPEGIPASAWLFNEGGIRFKGAWFYWLFAKRVGEVILGYWGLVPLGVGMLCIPSKKEGWLFRLWLIGALAYLSLIARGNVQHDYYQIFLLPVLSVYLGKGFAFLLSNSVFSRAISYQLSAISFLFMLSFSWYTVRTYYWINRPEIVEAGRAANQLLPKDAKVIAPYNGDTTFLYQTNRQGWPVGFDIEKKIALGATHYVTVSPTDNDLETRDLARQYTVLVRNDTFAIIDLTRRSDSP